jgi:hypothetical protein
MIANWLASAIVRHSNLPFQQRTVEALGFCTQQRVAQDQTSTSPRSLPKALKQVMTQAGDIELLFAIWEQNLDTVRALNKCLKREPDGFNPAQRLVAHLKQCAISLTKAPERNQRFASQPMPSTVDVQRQPKIDKSVLALSEPKRYRSKEHLRFVARQPCLICGRMPSQAHHIRYAQSRGLVLKVSDEFTVPLCAIHHTENHATGDERRWWRERNIDPLPLAEKLWRKGRERLPIGR